MKYPLILLAAAALAAPPAARADTLVSLSSTANVAAAPDQIDASLRATADAPSAAAAQQGVNRQAAGALTAAKATAGIQAETGQYSVWETQPPGDRQAPPTWHAAQSLSLKSSDGAAMLALVGRLQHQGLAVEQLDWRLSDKAQTAAHEAALRKALLALRGRAEMIAGLLGLHFASFRTVRVDQPAPPPVFPVMRAMVASAETATPPSAQTGPVTVTATVAAEAVLTPATK